MKRYIGYFCIVGLAIFCVILHMQLKLYSRRFVPLLAPNHVDTTDCIMYLTPACLTINFLGNLSSILQETLKSHDSRSALSVFLLLNLTMGVITFPFFPFSPSFSSLSSPIEVGPLSFLLSPHPSPPFP